MSNFESIKPGMTAERTLPVQKKLTVSHTKTAVLATPMMIWLMESVSKDLIQPLLPPGFTTVGYEVHVKHKAVALLGAQIRVWCKLLEADGRKLQFEVKVTEGEKVIGEGLHRRTIIPIPI